jgi:hypothetical protein
LIDRGWQLHRIWSTDWFHRPQEQLRQTVAAIEAARNPSGRRIGAHPDPATGKSPNGEILRDSPTPGSAINGMSAVPYQQSRFPIAEPAPIHETHRATVAGYVVRIVQDEGPIHQDEIVRRLVELWGGQRTSKRSGAAVVEALGFATRSGQILQDGQFYSHRRDRVSQVRSRGDIQSASLRRPDMLPPSEIRMALIDITRKSLGIASSEAIVECARMLGFGATSAQLQSYLDQQIKALCDSGKLIEKEGKIYLP